jgi:hypothetical protein
MLLEGAQGFNLIGGGVFQAGGVPGTSGEIRISPSYNGTSGMLSNHMNINTTFVNGIRMQASQHGHFSAYLIGHVEGGVQPGWVNSKWIDPEGP